MNVGKNVLIQGWYLCTFAHISGFRISEARHTVYSKVQILANANELRHEKIPCHNNIDENVQINKKYTQTDTEILVSVHGVQATHINALPTL